MRPVLYVLCLALTLSSPLSAQEKFNPDKDLHSLFSAEWERYLRQSPVMASYIGDHRYDDRWPDLSPAGLKVSYEGDKAVIAALDRIDIRAFHDVVLGSGAIPLDVLEANVRRWMATQP